MARDDDRERIAPECLADGARRPGRAEPRRDIAIGERLSRRDRASRLIDGAVERRHVLHVELDCREVARLAAEQRDDFGDSSLRLLRRRYLRRGREPLQHALSRLRLARFGKLYPNQATITPGDTARADRRIEKRKSVCRHAAIVPSAPNRHTPLISLAESQSPRPVCGKGSIGAGPRLSPWWRRGRGARIRRARSGPHRLPPRSRDRPRPNAADYSRGGPGFRHGRPARPAARKG